MSLCYIWPSGRVASNLVMESMLYDHTRVPLQHCSGAIRRTCNLPSAFGSHGTGTSLAFYVFCNGSRC